MGNSGSAHHINIERSGIDRSAHFQTRFQHQTQHSHRQFEWSRSVLRSIPSSPQRSLTTEWRRSYPSALLKKESGSPMESSLKVLPEVDKRLHLRATTNGAILNSGGTISGRKQNENQLQNVSHILSQQSKTFVLETVHDSSSGSNKKTDTRPELTRSQTLLHIKAKQKDSASNMNDSNLFRMQRHTYSEPELINSLNQQAAVTTNMQEQPLRANNRMKYSKKRRAPEVPQAVTATTPLIKNNTEILRNTPSSKSMHYAKNADRKLSKQIPSSVPTQTEPLINRDHGIRKSVNETNCQRNSHERPKFAFRREKSSDAILLRSQRLIQPEIKANSLISKVNDYQRDKNQILDSTFENETSPQKENFDNGVVSVQENKCQRTFYFGMETDVVDIHSIAFAKEKLPSDEVSNYDTLYKENSCREESLNDNGLLVRIRPTLPRRQMDTPSFSPTLAWRSLIEHQEHIDKSKILNTLNSPKTTTGETPIQFNRTSQMKQLAKPSHILQNWTPEQDLVDENDDKIKGLITGDDSSSDDYRSKCEGDSLLFYGGKAKNVGSSIHTFSLSLPRDTHTQHSRNIVNLEVCNYKSLQKSRPENDLNGASAGSSSYQRTSSLHQQENIAVSNLECSNNWMLHKNVSGTENYTKSLDHGSKRQRLVPLEAQSIKFLTGGKHVMYLPGSNDQTNSMKVYKAEPKANIQEPKSNRYFKSRQRPMPQSLQDETPVFPIMAMNEEALPLEDDKPFHHRFWFNNPVRLLEKRLNADKSGKSSKLKVSLDGQIEALKKVEEDFQRNRANEKENIQHQLRLYFGTDDDQYQSLPIAPVLDRFSNINLNDTSNKLFSRDDPEGCVSMVPFTEHESNDKKITISSANI